MNLRTQLLTNARRAGKTSLTNALKNYASGDAIAIQDPKFDLYIMTVSSMVDDNYYQTAGEHIQRLRHLVTQLEPEFVVKLAIYARTELNLRTVPLVLLVELAKIHNGDNLVSQGLERCIQRPDELVRTLEIYKDSNCYGSYKLLSKQVTKGVAKAFNKFDRYQLAKYRMSNNDLTLRDVMFLTHPKPKDEEQAALFKELASDTLRSEDTWEARQSAAGQEGLTPKGVWEQMIDERKIGYMACLRNLRNFLADNISAEHIAQVAEYLTNHTAISRSKQLPFRFYTAYRELQRLKDSYLLINNKEINLDSLEKLKEAVSYAAFYSLSNLDLIQDGDVIMSMVDTSGSMGNSMTANSTVSVAELALFYGSMFNFFNDNCRLGYFGTNVAFEEELLVSPFENAMNLREHMQKTGHSTNAHLILDLLLEAKHKVDKIFLWTDCQFWNSDSQTYNASFMQSWNKYSEFSPESKIYLIDVVGYGRTSPLSIADNVSYIHGFSAETFRTIATIQNAGTAIEYIESSIQLS
jgi:hypothetical protein